MGRPVVHRWEAVNGEMIEGGHETGKGSQGHSTAHAESGQPLHVRSLICDDSG